MVRPSQGPSSHVTPGVHTPPPSFLPSKLTAAGVVVLLAYIGIESLVVLVVTASNRGGALPFNSSSVVLAVEAIKLAISLVGLWQSKPTGDVLPVGAPGAASGTSSSTSASSSAQGGGAATGLQDLRRITPASFLKYGVPSLIYAVNNNLDLFIMTVMSGATFQLLLNSRVVWTGLAFRWLLNRHLTRQQWVASCVLLLGCALSQMSSAASSSGAAAHGGGDGVVVPPAVSLYGFALAMVYCLLSVTASVYNELLMKTEPSLHLSNIQLYSFGVLMNLAGLFYQVRVKCGVLSCGVWRVVCCRAVVPLPPPPTLATPPLPHLCCFYFISSSVCGVRPYVLWMGRGAATAEHGLRGLLDGLGPAHHLGRGGVQGVCGPPHLPRHEAL
jgi:hypothetical protein